MTNTSCLNASTLTALGTAYERREEFGRSDTQSSDPEAQLYRYVMASTTDRQPYRRHRNGLTRGCSA